MQDRYTNLIRRFRATLFALLLLLPFVQLAALSHLLTHTHPNHADAPSVSHADSSAHTYHCAVCLSAEAILGSAPLVQIVTHSLELAPLDLAPPPGRSRSASVPPRHYQSRAPPLFLI